MKQMQRGVQEYSKTSVLTDMTILPHVSLRNSALKKQRGAKSTRIYKFSGDKTGNRKNIFTSQHDSSEELPPPYCMQDKNKRLLTTPLAYLDLH